MSAGLIILLGLVAWSLGPFMLRCIGAVLLVTALLLWAVPTASHTSAETLVGTALIGALTRYVGTTWGTMRASLGWYRRGARR